MEIILFKIIAASTVFITLYYSFLARERTFKFNRFYLLFALVFSYAVPFITIQLPSINQSKNQLIFNEMQGVVVSQNQPAEATFNWETLLLSIYLVVTLFLFIKSIWAIIQIVKLKGYRMIINKLEVKVIEKNVSPFSFFNTIYLGKNYLNQGRIDERILLHEGNHITQKHSWDLMFIEALKIVSWFNPALYFYKKAMVANHEFLADEAVLNHFEVKPYQHLILDEISTAQNLNFTHQFNYNNTKKRFIMMTKTKSKFAGIKMYLSIPVFAVTFTLLVNKVYATPKDESVDSKPILSEKREIISPQEIDGNIIEESILSHNVLEQPNANQNEVADKSLQQTIVQDTIKPTSKGYIETNLISPPTPIGQKPEENIESATDVEVDKLPEYPGGINEFRQKLAMDFDTSKIEGTEGLFKTEVNFVINENGSVSNYTVSGNNENFNNEAVRSMKTVNDKTLWKPAIKDGKPVKFVFKMPITMEFKK